MHNADIPANVHRFNDHVAFSIGDGATLYITPSDALKLTNALMDCAVDIERRPKFVSSIFPSTDFIFKGKVS